MTCPPAYFHFNPRSYKRSDLQRCEYHLINFSISIHAPTRGATLMNFLTDVLYEFQSTLLQEERHVGNGYMYWISKISIHAPTRGATHGPCECLQLYPYFNPRSYKRSDYYDVVVDRDVDLFQSTLLQEERRNLELLKQIRLDDFNPRSYKRSDNCNTSHFMRNIQFQSTLLQEERQLSSLRIS